MGLLDRREMRRKARAIFKRLTVDIDLDCPVEQLSVAQQQFVEIAKALSLDARILVLDEPTATLTPGEAEHLFSIMHDLKLLGVGMVFISHHLDEIFTICDQITVLRDGAYIQTLPAAETNVEELVKLMVGRKIENTFPVKSHPVDTSVRVLEATVQHTKHVMENSFHLYKGEILGFAGLVGSGRTELMSALIGARSCYQRVSASMVSPPCYVIQRRRWITVLVCYRKAVKPKGWSCRFPSPKTLRLIGMKTRQNLR